MRKACLIHRFLLLKSVGNIFLSEVLSFMEEDDHKFQQKTCSAKLLYLLLIKASQYIK